MDSTGPVSTSLQKQQRSKDDIFPFFSLPLEIQKLIYGHIAQGIQEDRSYQNFLYRCHERGRRFYWGPSYQYSELRVCTAFAENLESLLIVDNIVVVSTCYDQIRFRCRFDGNKAARPVSRRTIALVNFVFFDHLAESMLNSTDKNSRDKYTLWSELRPEKVIIGPPDGKPAPLGMAMYRLKSAAALLPSATSIKCAYVTFHSPTAPDTHQNEAERMAIELGIPRPEVRFRGFFSEVCLEARNTPQATT